MHMTSRILNNFVYILNYRTDYENFITVELVPFHCLLYSMFYEIVVECCFLFYDKVEFG